MSTSYLLIMSSPKNQECAKHKHLERKKNILCIFMDSVVLIVGPPISYVRCFESRYVGYRSRLLLGQKKGKGSTCFKKKIADNLNFSSMNDDVVWHQILVTYAE